MHFCLKRRLRHTIWVCLCAVFIGLPLPSFGSVDSVQVPTISKPTSQSVFNYSGDQQYLKADQLGTKPLRVLVQDQDQKGVPDIAVRFTLISHPGDSTNFQILQPLVYTNSSGIAATYFAIGSDPGNYFILATATIPGSNFLVYELHTRDTKWLILMIAGLLGGLSLFLLGMIMMSESLKKAAGEKMRTILTNITKNRFIAVGIGALVTMVIQSSSATTVMLVGFVQSGLMTFAQSLGIILGADIGTTITAQIIAFKLTDYALWFVAAGFATQLIFHDPKIKQVGNSILGFGILFYGIHLMSESMEPLKSFEPFINAILHLENPWFGILLGALLTALFQSSSAFIGIIIIISTQGLISLEAAIALLLGANLGTAVTAILASLEAKPDAKRVALANAIFKIFGILVFVWWIPKFAEFIQFISPKGDASLTQMDYMAEVVPRQIANAHTLFNVGLTILALPFTGFFVKFIQFLLPDKKEKKTELRVQFLDENLLSTPSLALSVAKQEVIRIGHQVQDMLNDIILPFLTKDRSVLEIIREKEKLVKFLRDEVNAYLRKLTRNEISDKRINETFQIMYTVKELEHIADIISRNLIRRAGKWISSTGTFTVDGKKDLVSYQVSTQKQLSRALKVFSDVNLEKAREMKAKNKKYRRMAIELERHHFERIKNEIKQSVESSETHLELLTGFKMITSHATNIARVLLEWTT